MTEETRITRQELSSEASNYAPSPIAMAAIEYAERGWHVFPVPPGTKKSYLSKDYSGGRNWGASADVSGIQRTFKEYPTANVGIACGPSSGIIVIEADTVEGHGVDGIGNLAALVEANSPLPETVMAISPTGSVHYYFCSPEGVPIKNSAGQIAAGVDVRGDGGMVIGVPSVKPGWSKPYRWLKSPETTELAECPDWLQKLCLKPVKVKPLRQPAAKTLPDTSSSWAAAALREELLAVEMAPEGERNDQLNKSAFSLGQIVGGGYLDGQTVIAALTNAALAAGLNDAETRATIESGMTAGSDHPRGPAIEVPARSFEEMMAEAQTLSEGDVDEAGELANEAHGLPSIHRDAVLKAIKKATDISLAALREFGATERAEKYALANPEPDHLELARAVIARIGPQNILVDSAGCWQYRDKGVWQLQEEAVLKQAIQCVLEDQGERVIANKVSGVSTTLRSHAFQRDHRFDIGNPETINCLNGQLELDDEFGWELKPHNRADYRTTQIPVLYDHSATAPMFMQFLDDVFRDDGDKEAKKKSLLELIGYTLTSHARHEKFAILIGPGANGKSVLLSVLEGLCGHENVAGVQPSNFNNKYQRAHLHGKLANIVTELRQGETVADAELKAITSGEPATVENKNQTPFVMRPFATCWFGSNHMPHTRDFSPALFRRAVIFRFGRTFATHEQDPNLKDKLLTELPGILKEAIWAYALAVLGGNGFTEAPSSLEEKKAWRLEADQVAGFVDECCISDPLGIVPIGELFNFYRKWASHQGLKLTLNKKNFRSRLTTLGFGQGPRREARTVSGLQIAPTMRAEVEGYQVNPLPFR